MVNAFVVLLAAAVLCAAGAFWVLRAYRRAGGAAAAAMPALIACGVAAIAALAGYLLIGRPELTDAPYEQRLEALKQRDPTTYSTDEALAILSAAAKQHPTDPLPYFYTGELLMGQGRAQEAARAYDLALRRAPQNVEALLGLGRAMVEIEGGRVGPDALAVFQQAAQLTNDPAPWLYQAMAAMEEGREDDARRLWGEAYRRMPENDPRREMARSMMAGG